MILVLIKYHNINIRMISQGSVQGNFLSEIYTHEDLRKFLYQILDQRTPHSNYAFDIHSLYIECPNKLKGLPNYITQHLFNEVMRFHTFDIHSLYIEGPNKSKDLPNYITQHLFNEVIQLFIDIKEQDRIRDNNVNNIILNVKFNDSNDRSSTKLVAKLIQVYNTSKSIKISLDTRIVLSEIQESLVDKDLSVWYKNNRLISNANKEIKPSTILRINSQDVHSSNAASQSNDELTEKELKITENIRVEYGLIMEEVIGCCCTPAWCHPYAII